MPGYLKSLMSISVKPLRRTEIPSACSLCGEHGEKVRPGPVRWERHLSNGFISAAAPGSSDRGTNKPVCCCWSWALSWGQQPVPVLWTRPTGALPTSVPRYKSWACLQVSAAVPPGNFQVCSPTSLSRVLSFFYLLLLLGITFREVTFPKQLIYECWFCSGVEWPCTVLSAVL